MLKVERDISERQAFFNCLNFLESSTKRNNDVDGVFTINYLKWLLHKFNLPFCYLEQEKSVKKENGNTLVAHAKRDKGIIYIDYQGVNLFNVHENAIHLAHELTHVADFFYYQNKFLLGKDREYQSYNGTFNLAQNFEMGHFGFKEDYVNYYLKDEEIAARRTGNFYGWLFCSLITEATSKQYIKETFKTYLKDIKNYSNYNNELLYEYTFKTSNSLNYLTYLELIKVMAKNGLNNIEKTLSENKQLSPDVVHSVRGLVLTANDKKIAKRLVDIFNKNNIYYLRVFILQCLAEMPFDVMPESSINSFLLCEPSLNVACSYAAPEPLAHRLLFIWGTNKFKKEIALNKNNMNISRLLPYFEKVLDDFKDYNIVGLKNMKPCLRRVFAERKFINSKNFILTQETLLAYNKMLGGKLLSAQPKTSNNLEQEKTK